MLLSIYFSPAEDDQPNRKWSRLYGTGFRTGISDLFLALVFTCWSPEKDGLLIRCLFQSSPWLYIPVTFFYRDISSCLSASSNTYWDSTGILTLLIRLLFLVQPQKCLLWAVEFNEENNHRHQTMTTSLLYDFFTLDFKLVFLREQNQYKKKKSLFVIDLGTKPKCYCPYNFFERK